MATIVLPRCKVAAWSAPRPIGQVSDGFKYTLGSVLFRSKHAQTGMGTTGMAIVDPAWEQA